MLVPVQLLLVVMVQRVLQAAGTLPLAVDAFAELGADFGAAWEHEWRHFEAAAVEGSGGLLGASLSAELLAAALDPAAAEAACADGPEERWARGVESLLQCAVGLEQYGGGGGGALIAGQDLVLAHAGSAPRLPQHPETEADTVLAYVSPQVLLESQLQP